VIKHDQDPESTPGARGPTVLRLFPLPGKYCALPGLYLAHDLRARGLPGHPLVYTNFVSSLDGRISWRSPQGHREVPPAIGNPHDLRLYHELSAQADVLLTSSRHLQATAAGRSPGMLSYGEHARGMLKWRAGRGLAPYPQVAVVSNSLRLPDRDSLGSISGEITILTWRKVSAGERRVVEKQGYRLIACGSGGAIDGASLVDALGGECRTIYSVAGPGVHSALIRAGCLDRLYLTLTQVLLGGDEFDSLTSGEHFSPAPGLALAELYSDPAEPDGKGQLFAVLDRLPQADPRGARRRIATRSAGISHLRRIHPLQQDRQQQQVGEQGRDHCQSGKQPEHHTGLEVGEGQH
jgi:riboflavin biosynthesis pyrimidine reductase